MADASRNFLINRRLAAGREIPRHLVDNLGWPSNQPIEPTDRDHHRNAPGSRNGERENLSRYLFMSRSPLMVSDRVA